MHPILVVEDNPSDAALAQRSLARWCRAMRLDIVQDGQVALDCLFREGAYADRSAGDDPALVLLDLKLPRVDGLEILKRMRKDQRTASIPVVLLAVSPEQQESLAHDSTGATACIVKPLDRGKLETALRRVGLAALLQGGVDADFISPLPPAGP